MKKRILILLSLLAGIVAVFAFAACKEKTEHSFELKEVLIEATCTEKGSGKYVCTECGVEETRTIEPLGHNWDKLTTLKLATCTESGTELRTCSRNSAHTETHTISPLGHDWGKWEASNAVTCTTQGTDIRTCKRNSEHTDSRIVEPLGHDWNEWEVLNAATCTGQGTDIRTCKHNPDHTESRTVEPLGHDWSEWKELRAATCTWQGVDSKTCNNCELNEYRNTNALGHDWGEWTVKTPVSCLVQGEDVRTCSHDSSHTETRTNDPLGHTSASQEWSTLQESTCVITGTEAILCDRCSAAIESRRTAALEHEYTDGVCNSCGRRDWQTAAYDDPDLYSSEYGFRMLAEEEKGANLQEFYRLIDTDARAYHIGNSDSTVLGEYEYASLDLTEDEMIAVWKTFMNDHPLYYWFKKSINYTIYTAKILVDESYSNHAVRADINRIIYDKARVWREDTDENAYFAALSFHDKIINEVNYAYSSGTTPEDANWAHNIVGVFEGRGAVCEGYARSFQLLLNMTGIENVYVTGTSGTTKHAWNMVKLDDGEWYHFDLTFDDSPDWMWGVRYNYFAVDNNQNVAWSDGDWTHKQPEYFTDEHTPNSGTGIDFLVQLPEASDTSYDMVGDMRLRETFTVDKFTYAIAGYHAVQIISCTATGDVNIPETVEYGGVTYDVISIGAMKDGKFSDAAYNKVYTAPIETLHIPATIRFLWSNAVHNNGNGGFTAFDVSEESELFASVDGVLYTKDMYTLISYPSKASATEYRIPDSVNVLAHDAFDDGGINLRSLTFGKNLRLPGNANWGYGWLCYSGKGSIQFVNGKWCYMFKYLSALETLSVDAENEIFSAENNILYNKDKTILYSGIYNIEKLVIPASVEEIENMAFYYYVKLKKITFEGNAIKQIGSGAFSNCMYLSEVIFNGTHAEWDAIEKSEANINAKATITCTRE